MSERISPTAHYTGYVWYAHGQSHDAFATSTGRLMYRALRAPNAAAHATGLPTPEGLINYFDRDTVIGMWRRFARALARFPRGIYYSDIILRDGNAGAFANAFMKVLGTFVRGAVFMPFGDAADVEACLDSVGLDGV